MRAAITSVTQSTILRPGVWCTIRAQEVEYLFYNSKTDELHLVPPTGFFAYSLCDGLRTVSEVCETMVGAASQGTLTHEAVEAFLLALVERGILERNDV